MANRYEEESERTARYAAEPASTDVSDVWIHARRQAQIRPLREFADTVERIVNL
ncbi:hypothetical protein [Streptomyces boluensis]|uniref:Uncharacterized protein n=1 Tax=Streptomyces boluensis TaxID=1775135 RepID=A0A964XNU1_9ACTN|nr:hypothetical protein [Streptomyces boluensis]NBE56019.1 hypothetical protein [Streptomyces boluensis]